MGIVTLVSAIVGTGVAITGAVAGMGFALWRLIARDNDALRSDIRDIRAAGVGGLRERMARIGGWFEGFARECRPDVQPDASDRSRRPLGERT